MQQAQKCCVSDRLNSCGKSNWTRKEKLYVTQHIAQKVSEVTADKFDNEEEDQKKRRKPKWSKGLSNGEQMFCMALTMEAKYSDVEDTDDEEL